MRPLFVSLVALAFLCATAHAHDVEKGRLHNHPATEFPGILLALDDTPGVTGQGDYTFRVLHDISLIPKEAHQRMRRSAHGGFAIDRRPGHGEAYFGLPGVGVLRVDNELAKVEILPTPDELRRANLHNGQLWIAGKNRAYITWASTSANKVFTTSIKGYTAHTLNAPTADTFSNPVAKEYFQNGGAFVPTDVDLRDGVLYVTTGYSPLDFVLTARLTQEIPPKLSWDQPMWGGKGTEPGKFQTSHGVTVEANGKTLVIADRANERLQRFTTAGELLDVIDMPEGSLPCDVDFLGPYMLVPCLYGKNREAGAPIYLYKNGELVSTIRIREDLGINGFRSVHNAVLREIDGKLYILALAWMPGDFAILEQIVE